MTAEIVNLKRFRKQQQRASKAAAAEANRARTGRTKAERAASASEQEKLARVLDNAERQTVEMPVEMPLPIAANAAGFPTTASHDDDDELDPGNVS